MKNTVIKNIKKSIISLPLALILVFGFIGCEIDNSINNSPNAINESKVKSLEGMNGLLISLQVATVDFYSGDRSRIASMWSRQMCAPEGLGRPQPVSWNSYQFQTDGFVDDMWKLGYRGVRIANDIINNAGEVNFSADNEKSRNTYFGMAKAYKAILLGELAAFYGSIPITFNGLEAAKFATQSEAYAEVQKLLSEALVHFQNPAAVSRDLNYGGDGAQWTKALHSLKARYYLHTMDYTNAQTEAEQGLAVGDAGLFGIYNDAAGEFSTWGHWALTEVGEPIRATNTFVRLLQSEAGDNRLASYLKPNEDGNFIGFAYFDQANATPDELDINKLSSLLKYGLYTDDFPLISYNETLLILAESQARNGQNAPAAANLNAIRKEAGLGDYAGTNLISEILNQKYLQLFLEGQVYTDMRRTNTKPDSNMPMRFIYPITEFNANPNVPVDNDNLVIWSK